MDSAVDIQLETMTTLSQKLRRVTSSAVEDRALRAPLPVLREWFRKEQLLGARDCDVVLSLENDISQPFLLPAPTYLQAPLL